MLATQITPPTTTLVKTEEPSPTETKSPEVERDIFRIEEIDVVPAESMMTMRC